MKFFPFVLLCSSMFILGSCEKVIEIDLNESDAQLVIEAQLESGNHLFEVSVTQTGSYFDANAQPTIDNAVVTLYDGSGTATPILSVGNGKYQAQINAIEGNTYRLEVQSNGNTYIATSTLNQQVSLDQITTEYVSTPFFGEGYLVYFRYQDPAGVPNYYRVVHELNGIAQMDGDDLQIIDDNLNDGSNARFPIFQKVFDPGDTVLVELRHIDESAYDYFTSLSDIVSTSGGPNSGSAAPGNPLSNWSGNVLGHFTAYSSDTLSVVVPQ